MRLQQPLIPYFSLAILGVFSFLAGCDRDPMVRVYEVPREEKEEADGRPTRMLVAVIPNADNVYFVKAMGSPEELEAIDPGLRQIAAKMKVDSNGEIAWALPENWTREPGEGISEAILQAPGETKPLRLTVTRLPMPPSADDWEGYLESNINRWRGQLGLPPTSFANQRTDFAEVAREGDSLAAVVVDLQGVATSSRSMMGSMDSMRPSASGGGQANEPRFAAPSPSAAVRYRVPEGWKDEGARGMRMASLALGGNDDLGEVTVIMASGDRESNVERWQQQLDPEATPESLRQLAKAAIDEATSVRSGQGIEGELYSLRGSASEGQRGMLVAIFPAGETGGSLFVKMTGNARLVEENRDKLIEFISSLEW